jgi:hypothetical protein
LQAYPESVGGGEGAAGYPNEPWPVVGRDINDAATIGPNIAEAVRKLLDALGPLVRRD